MFIMSDDQGAWTLGSAGNKEIQTPNLDRLAEEWMRYDNFFCASPVCSPARASIVTGEIPSCHGILDWLSGGNGTTENHPQMNGHEHFKNKDVGIEYLEGHPSYISVLKDSGYCCGLSGKWHLGNHEYAKKGFDKWFTIFAGGCRYFDADTIEHEAVSGDNRYITTVITDKAIEYMNDYVQQEEPFYLSIHYTAPHSPWDEGEHPKEFIDKYKDCKFESTPDLPVHEDQINSCPVGSTPEKRRENLQGYYAAITAMDDQIGRVFEELERLGQLENTVVIFTADNGMNMGHHGIWGKRNGTYPANMYDTSVKVPFIIRAPFIKNKGVTQYSLRSHLDIFPTLCEMVGEEYVAAKKQSGTSFYRELLGGEEKDSTIAICSEYGRIRMMRNKKRKLVYDCLSGVIQYFDLEKDSDEANNLLNDADYQEEITRMEEELKQWFDRYAMEQQDGQQYPVVGKGQKNWCYEADAFAQTFRYYRDINQASVL